MADSISHGRSGLPLHHLNPSEPHRTRVIELRGPAFEVGIFRDTLLPNLGLHSSLAVLAYAAGRATDTVEAKDWLWPSAQIVNTWWSAVGRRVHEGLPLSRALTTLSRPERLLLTGVTLWGGRLFYRIASRTIRRGKDDPRYEAVKKESGFWNKALLTVFLPEVLFQTVISLPFTAPFRHQGGVFTGYHPIVQMVSVGFFSAGFALEVLADWQLEKHQESGNATSELEKEGVWSVVRHPNYLGDALIHLSFPLLLYSSDMLAPVELLGPLANYIFLRYVGGDKQNEESQEQRYMGEKKADLKGYQESRNSFWPDLEQLKNKWFWIVVGAGALGAAIEQVAHVLQLEQSD